MQKLFLAQTPRQFILTQPQFTTLLTREKIVCVEFVRPALNHGIIRKADACMYKCSSVPKQNEQLYKTGSARGNAWLGRISANNLLTLENASGLLRTLLPRCPIVFHLP